MICRGNMKPVSAVGVVNVNQQVTALVTGLVLVAA